MSGQDPRLPGTGITLRITRDDGQTFAGATFPGVNFSITNARAKIAAAPGLSGPEITRANALTFPGSTQPRDPVKFGQGWGIYYFPQTTQVYVVRDDGTHISTGMRHELFSIPAAIAALLTTSGLSAAEIARVNSIAL